MARPRRGKSRRTSDDWLIEYFTTGDWPMDDDESAFAYFVIRGDEWPAVWDAHRDAVMRLWDLPGCRPWGWWEFEAPRLPMGGFPGCFWDGMLPEPRRWISGTGCPLHERQAVVPGSRFGVWDWLGDPDAPPVFETQHAYLRRHGLLRAGERASTEPHPHPQSIYDLAQWERCLARLRRS